MKKSDIFLMSIVIPMIFIATLSISNAQEKPEVNKNKVEMHLKLGVYFRKEGNFEAAEYEFKKALSIEPENAVLYKEMGNLYFVNSKYNKAIVQYKKALSILPSYATVFNNMAGCYMHLGKYNEAIGFVNKAIEINSGVVAYYITSAEIYFRKSESGKAVELLKKANNYIQTTSEKDEINQLKSQFLIQ